MRAWSTESALSFSANRAMSCGRYWTDTERRITGHLVGFPIGADRAPPGIYDVESQLNLLPAHNRSYRDARQAAPDDHALLTQDFRGAVARLRGRDSVVNPRETTLVESVKGVGL
jgi:hypothetical protein